MSTADTYVRARIDSATKNRAADLAGDPPHGGAL